MAQSLPVDKVRARCGPEWVTDPRGGEHSEYYVYTSKRRACVPSATQVRDELGWAVRFDLSASVFCLLACGAPHGVAVLSPWSAAPSTCQRHARDFSMPLGYYVVMRGWRIPSIVDGVLAKGWTELQARPHTLCTW